MNSELTAVMAKHEELVAAMKNAWARNDRKAYWVAVKAYDAHRDTYLAATAGR